ncbi:MAG: adenylate/guanylate cyclase domain-containing protein [Chloroflexi bacterium OHK40]
MSLLPFLPYQIAAELMRQPVTLPEGLTRRLEAVVLFADISGFTPMSEALARLGQAGTEELTDHINAVFAAMIDRVASSGGMVASFGGDALTALFPIAGGGAARAAQCAHDMQRLMQAYGQVDTRAGRFTLAIKIGLAAGPVLSAVVGDPALRLQSVLAGTALDHAAEAEHLAHSGEVVMHPGLATLLPGLAVLETRSGYLVASGVAVAPPRAPLPPLPAPAAELQPTLAAFVHPAIARRLADDRAGLVNEHRSVSVLFVGFDGIDYDGDPGAYDRLQRYVAAVTREVERYGGDLNKLDFGDKGSKCVVVFGAPVAHENSAERAMHCALALRDLPGPAARIGIAAGLVYCGLVGATLRREYTVMGDTVNLAARLMQAAAPGEIVVASGAHRPVAEQFIWEPLEPLPVKGRSRPVTVYRLLRARERSDQHYEPAYKLPMVGREAEMQLIEQRLELALRGQGQVLGVAAEAGMGKSRLVAEVVRMAARRGVTVLSGECLSHGVSVSYLPWHSLLRGLFGINSAWSAEAQLRHLRHQIAAVDQQILARLPLLAVALNLEIGETDLTRSLDARVRKDALETTVIACVRAITGGRRAGREAAATPSPTLMVIEDCHWIDLLSHDLLEVVARSIVDRPVLLLLAYRPPERDDGRLRVTRLPHFTEVRLREFSLRETEWLIGLKFGYLFGARGVLPASFVQRITERSQGNPFYIDQMINYIQDQGISPADATALEAVRLPDSLRALIISRIDRLSPQEQATLKVASVLGRAFRASWLGQIYPPLGGPEQVRGLLEALSRLDLTSLERDGPEQEYLFKHVVTQEVAYESLTLSTRTMLHGAVGRFIERQFAGDLERYLDLLAFHYGRSDDSAKQRQYFALAADAARVAYANAIALDYYRRLRALLPPDQQTGALLREAEVLQLVGRWSEAEAAVGEAITIAEQAGDDATIARCRTEQAHLLALRGDYDAAIALIDEVMPVWEQLDDPSGHYEALWVLGTVLIDLGEYTRGLRQLEHTHEIAVRLGDRRLIARSIGSMGLVYVEISDDEMALYCLERSAAMAQEFSDWGLLARTRGGIGFVLLRQHRAPEALAIFHELLLRAAEIGDRRFVARFAREIGRCHQLMGDMTGALRCYALQVAVGLELGERRDLSIGLGFLASAYAQLGDARRAARVGDLAVALCDSIRLVYWSCEFRYERARLADGQGEQALAARLAEEVIRSAGASGCNRPARLGAQLLAARLRVADGLDPAVAVDGIEALDEEWYGAEERAAIRYTVWKIDPTREDARVEAARLYAACAAERPTAATLARRAELTGSAPALPALPELPELIARQHYDLAALIDQAEALVGAPARD